MKTVKFKKEMRSSLGGDGLYGRQWTCKSSNTHQFYALEVKKPFWPVYL